jgi:hypothetical protein
MDKKGKGGRPREKVADKVDFIQVEKLAGFGMTDVEIGSILNITDRTLRNYKKDPQFLSALKDGKAKINARVVQSLYKRAMGYSVTEKTFEQIRFGNGTATKNVKVKTVVKHIEPNPTCLIFFLKNRMPEVYRDVRADAPGDKPSPDQGAKLDQIIADAESRVERAGAICH